MYCKVQGHEEENLLGLCFNQACSQEPRFCYFCKEEKHSEHKNQCIRFDVLNKQIVEIHNALIQLKDKLRECQKQISYSFRNLIDSQFIFQIDRCYQLHKIFSSKNYEEVKASLNLIQNYYEFDMEQLKLYGENILSALEVFQSKIKGIQLQDFKIETFVNSTQFNKKDQDFSLNILPNNESQQNNQQNLENNNNDDDEALLQLMLQESQNEIIVQNFLKSESLTNQAQQHMSNSNFNQAISLIEEAISLNQNNDEAIRLKANVLNHQNKQVEAIKYFNTALTLNPYNSVASQDLALILLEQNQLDQAQQVVDDGIKNNPSFSKLYSAKATILNQQRRYKEAINLCDKAIELDKSDAYTYNKKANSLLLLEKYEESLEALEIAIKLNQDNPVFWANKGVLLLKMKKINEAKSHLAEIEQKKLISSEIIVFKCQQVNYYQIFYISTQLRDEGKFQEACEQGLLFYPNEYQLIQFKRG